MTTFLVGDGAHRDRQQWETPKWNVFLCNEDILIPHSGYPGTEGSPRTRMAFKGGQRVLIILEAQFPRIMEVLVVNENCQMGT